MQLSYYISTLKIFDVEFEAIAQLFEEVLSIPSCYLW